MKSHGDVKQVFGKRVATTEYRSWQMMKNRCLNVNSSDYKYYGGRGIKICKRWMQYENFLLDMGRKPDATLTLERKNTNGNYSKQNCIWATRTTQARNRVYVKLSMQKARKIRKLYNIGKLNQYELAVLYQVSQPIIGQVINNRVWRENRR